MAYGKDTDVPFERSIAEIVQMVDKAGADAIGQLQERERFSIQFTLEERMVRFRVAFPSAAEVKAATGPRQDPAKVEAQMRRQRGRALMLVIKAKLESVESGVETFEQAFLSNVVLADGATVYERIAAPIASEYETRAPSPRLLGGPRK